MRLKTLILQNFRVYQQEIRIPFNNLTAFIGRNDIGKSTILEALDIFFEGGIVKIDKSDACIYGNAGNVVIGCVFDELPDELVLDTTSETNLRDEYLLNQDGDLEIHKIFDCTKGKISPSVFAVAYHPTANEYHDLLSLKQSDLRKRCQKLGINLDNLDQRKNAELRKAIWANPPIEGLQLAIGRIALDKDDSKDIWDKISRNLPLYALFQSDRSSTDGDSEVQDPMKIAIKQAIAKVQEKIEEIKRLVENEVTDVAKRTLEKLAEMNPELAQSLTPKFNTEPQWDKFGFRLDGDNGIPINKRGSGIRRLILLNFFRAEAERKATSDNKQSIIYAIEEPETSQHPNYQKMLIEALLDLSENPNYQVIITTHVPALAGMIPLQYLRYIDKGDNGIQVEHGKEGTFRKIANTLGIQVPPHYPKMFFCVEGLNDVWFWQGMTSMINKIHPHIPDLSTEDRIAIIPVGGENLQNWINNDYLRNINVPQVHIYDGDKPQYQSSCDIVNKRNNGSWAVLTPKNTIENYLHCKVIHEVFGIEITFGDKDNVVDLIHQHPSNKLGKGKIKSRLSQNAVQKMTYELLKISDPNNDIIGWLEEIAKMLQ